VGAGKLYVGGAFTAVGTTAQPFAAAFDLTTGAFNTTWRPTVDAEVEALTLTSDSSKVVLGGHFSHLNGALSPSIGAVDPTTGASLPWSWHPPFPSRPAFDIVSLTADANGVFAAGTGNGGTFTAMRPSDGTLLWDGGVNGNAVSVALLAGELYVGGHFTAYCGPGLGVNRCPSMGNRQKLLAVDELTGALQAWHPSANTSLGVFVVGAGGTHVAAGGDFTKLGGVNQQGFGAFSQ
jgi:outer membrane protein assembly factor BamB